MSKHQSDEDIVKIGVWLNSQGFFNVHWGAYALWLMHVLMLYTLQGFAVYKVMTEEAVFVVNTLTGIHDEDTLL